MGASLYGKTSDPFIFPLKPALGLGLAARSHLRKIGLNHFDAIGGIELARVVDF